MNKFLFLLLAIFVLGCSKNSSSGGGNSNAGPELNTDKATKVAKSLAAIQEFSNSQRQQKSNWNKNNNQLLFFAIDPKQNQNEVQANASKLEKAVNGKCEVKIPFDGEKIQPKNSKPNNGMNFSVTKFRVEVSGSQCPISLVMELNGEAKDQSMTVNMTWNYQVKNEDLQKDLDLVSFSGSGSYSMSMQDAQNGMTISMNGQFSGQGTSKTEGTFSLSAGGESNMMMPSMNQNSRMNPPSMAGSMSDKFEISMNGASTRMRSSHVFDSSKSEEHFYINDNEVSADKYQEVMGSLELFGQENKNPNSGSNQPNYPNNPNQPNYPPQPSNPNQPNFPTEPNYPNQPNHPNEPNNPNQPSENWTCEFNLYNKSEVSVRDIMDSFRSGKSISKRPLASLEVRDLNQTNVINYNSAEIQISKVNNDSGYAGADSVLINVTYKKASLNESHKTMISTYMSYTAGTLDRSYTYSLNCQQ